MFTSFDDDQVRGMAASAGVQAVVNKATPAQLVSAVRSLLSVNDDLRLASVHLT